MTRISWGKCTFVTAWLIYAIITDVAYLPWRWIWVLQRWKWFTSLWEKIKNKHKPQVNKSLIPNDDWCTDLWPCAPQCARAWGKAGEPEDGPALAHVHVLHMHQYKYYTDLRRLWRPFQTYLLQCVMSWCSLRFKCHVPSAASFLWASPAYREALVVIVFQAHKHIHKFPERYRFLWHLFPPAFCPVLNPAATQFLSCLL